MRVFIKSLVLLALMAILVVQVAAENEELSQGEMSSPLSLMQEREPLLRTINNQLFSIFFFDVSQGIIRKPEVDRDGNIQRDEKGGELYGSVPIPLVVLVLLIGSFFFTFYYRWINVRGFLHAINILRGRYDDKEDKGEISHFRALTSALSATVGLGNIAGVAVAIQAGGPGAVFWMMAAAVFGMSAKFSSCMLAQMYRKQNSDGSYSGGPMYYIDLGLKSMGRFWKPLGKFLGIFYALCIMGTSIGGGNMFQVNQTTEAIKSSFGIPAGSEWIVGVVMAVLVAVVILGGVKRIGAATSRLVPAMCGIYVIAAMFVIFSNIDRVPDAIQTIFTMAFTENAYFGGLLGVLITGMQRATFSNEAGIGSASIIYAAAKSHEPVREGLVGMIGPVIDTMIVCMMTALVVVVTGTWENPELVAQGTNIGVTLTSAAFATVIPWFPYLLTVCIFLFAYSTLITWSYYGERGWIYIFDHFDGAGLKSIVLFRVIFVSLVVVGSVNSLSDVINFTDAMLFAMVIPNVIGSIVLAPKALPVLRDYWRRYKAGELEQG